MTTEHETVASDLAFLRGLAVILETRGETDNPAEIRRVADRIERAHARESAAQSPSYDALLLIAQSVCGALSRAGVTDCDDPGEAIDVLRERWERRLSAQAGVPVGWSIRADGDEIRITAPNGCPGGITLTPGDLDKPEPFDDLPLRLLYALGKSLLSAAPAPAAEPVHSSPAVSSEFTEAMVHIAEMVRAEFAKIHEAMCKVLAHAPQPAPSDTEPAAPPAFSWRRAEFVDRFPVAVSVPSDAPASPQAAKGDVEALAEGNRELFRAIRAAVEDACPRWGDAHDNPRLHKIDRREREWIASLVFAAVAGHISRAQPATAKPAGDEAISSLQTAIKSCDAPMLTEKGEQQASWDAVSFVQSHGKSVLARLTVDES